MSDRELIEMLAEVIKANTEASAKEAKAFEKVSVELRGLRATIQGAQRKIGQEIGPAIDRVKATQKTLNDELGAVRRAGG